MNTKDISVKTDVSATIRAFVEEKMIQEQWSAQQVMG